MPLRPWPPRRRGRRCSRAPLPTRRYRLVWHWRDDLPGRLRESFVSAATVDEATGALRRKVGRTAVDNVVTELVVIEAVPVEVPST